MQRTNKSCTKDTYTHSTITLLLQNTTRLGWEVRIFTSTAMFLHQYAIMQDTNRRQHARSFTGIRFRRLGRGPLLGRRPGSRLGFWGLAPGLLDSSIPQMTSRTRSCPPPIAQRKQASLVEAFDSAPGLLNSLIPQVLKKHHELAQRRLIQTHISTVPSLLGPDAISTSAPGSQSCQVCAVSRGQLIYSVFPFLSRES